MSEDSNNVILFPKQRKEGAVNTPEALKMQQLIELNSKIDDISVELVAVLCATIAQHNPAAIDSSGDLPESYDPDIGLVLEATRSLLLKTYSIKHPLQELASIVSGETSEDGVTPPRFIVLEDVPAEFKEMLFNMLKTVPPQGEPKE